ncbi:MAG: hypothetical protein IK052_01675 [Bacteroidales bacterium]|nr:hypothetical protein [Bacteroidales bacterium]
MKLLFLILSVLVQNAGNTFLEQVQKRDSILIADHLRYGVVLENVAEGTPLALPEFKMEGEGESPLVIVKGWQLDSTKVSKRKEIPARYDIRAYLTLAAFMGGTVELPDIPVLLDADTLVFKAADPVEIKELPVDMETFQPNDIKPQAKFPYTFQEVFPWAAGIWLTLLIIAGLLGWYFGTDRKRREAEALKAEPPHIRALRKLDAFRSNKFWKPEHQKAFYSGVTDTLREYMAARYGVDAMESTTAEIFEDLKKTDLSKELYLELKTLFERSDFVKFAKFTATDDENASVLPLAVRFVTETYQQEIAGDDSTVIPSEASVSPDLGSSHPCGVRDDKIVKE